jgi:hypothetical protein
MKKLKLEIDELSVESFAIEAGLPMNGTVQGHYGTAFGETCEAVATCGPRTCGPNVCVFETEAPCGDTNGCPPGSVGCPASGQFTCDGCTSRNYTNEGGDSCDFCMSFYTDSPQRCPCP